MNKLFEAIHGELDSERCSGRTTALALGYIAQAMRTPNKSVTCIDHCDTYLSHKACWEKAQDIVEKLQLKFVTFNHTYLSLIYRI